MRTGMDSQFTSHPQSCPVPQKMHPLLLLLQSNFSLLLIILSPAHSVLADDQNYQDCSSQVIRCGSLNNVRYPFWGMNRPAYCGYPGFELNCTDDEPEITIMSQKYRVLRIDGGSNIITVARVDYLENLCPTNHSNNTINRTLFQDTPSDVTANVTLYYGCNPITITNVNSYFNLFSCSGSNLNYYTTLNLGDFGPQIQFVGVRLCRDTVIVPAMRSQVENLGSSVSLTADNLVRTLASGFPLQWSANNSLCDDCRDTDGECGYNTDSGEFRCFCSDGEANVGGLTCPRTGNGSTIRRIVILASSGGVFGIFLSVLAFAFRRKGASVITTLMCQKYVMNDDNVEAIIVNFGSLAPKRYSYSDIRKMTRSFRDKVGKGGYGTVYRGRLLNGSLVAVKVLSESKGDGEEFINEVASIARTSHVNIVSLVGFCYQGNKKALVYEFMPNGSLDQFIINKGSSKSLGWATLYEIAIGIARGLEYLHRGCNTRILHFDIKPQNILLDKDLCPKISDFGLAKLCKRDESVVTMTGARGTIGYIAPEVCYRGYGGVSHKSDVYSYGMMVLEMVGGRTKPHENAASGASEACFPDWIYKDLERGNVGVPHEDMTEEEEETARKMVLVSLWCVQIIPSDRPSISKVVEMLEGSVHSLQVPPKPFFYSPAMQALDSSAGSVVQELSTS